MTSARQMPGRMWPPLELNVTRLEKMRALFRLGAEKVEKTKDEVGCYFYPDL